MTTHPLRCRCGTVQGLVNEPARAMGRGVCYCRDCQAFAHFLGRPAEVLDAWGGTDVVATHPQQVSITQGRDAIACMSLSPKGLLRWYASCCRTPIGNTARSAKMAYVGLVHNCLEAAGAPLEPSFGPATLRLNTGSAKGPVPERSRGVPGSMLRLVGALLRARLDGSWQRTPFFDAKTGAPIVVPQVLSLAERQQLNSAL